MSSQKYYQPVTCGVNDHLNFEKINSCIDKFYLRSPLVEMLLPFMCIENKSE